MFQWMLRSTKLLTADKNINFDIVWSIVINACQQPFRFRCVIRVTAGWFVGVTKVRVGSRSSICVAGNVNIMATSKCWSIPIIGVNCVTGVLIDCGFKRSQMISVGEGEYERSISRHVTGAT